MKVVAGSASVALASRLASQLDATLVTPDHQLFPDGEVYVRLDADLSGEHVVLVQTTYPTPAMVELFLLQDAVQQAGAAHVDVVVPYYAYSRQDQVFKPGEVVSARVVAEIISARADRVFTVDPHKAHILDFFSVPAHSVTAIPALAAHMHDLGVDTVLAPDKGALDRAAAAAKAMGAAFDHMEKTRLSGTEVRMAAKTLDVAGHTVAIVDDMIASGGTIATAAAELKRQGAAKVVAACTHGLFISGAVDRLKKAGCDEVFCADTIENAQADVSAAAALAAAILL